jgi:hypothetical protein
MGGLEKSVVLLVEDQELGSESAKASTSHNITSRFPPAFNLYCEASLKHYIFYIGGEKTQKLYAVSLHIGIFGKPDLILHDGPESSDQPLATVKNDGMLSRHSIVKIPSFPGSKLDNIHEDLRFHYGLKSTTCTFSIPIEYDAEVYVENFEWRQSHGDEVKALSGWPLGMKLVRSRNGTPERKGGKRKEREIGESSDGNEVVAVWAFHAKPSMTKIGMFQFLGSGATGELGEHWAIVAIVSVFRLWQISYAAMLPITVS